LSKINLENYIKSLDLLSYPKESVEESKRLSLHSLFTKMLATVGEKEKGRMSQPLDCVGVSKGMWTTTSGPSICINLKLIYISHLSARMSCDIFHPFRSFEDILATVGKKEKGSHVATP
jgi:hypothetical protein